MDNDKIKTRKTSRVKSPPEENCRTIPLAGAYQMLLVPSPDQSCERSQWYVYEYKLKQNNSSALFSNPSKSASGVLIWKSYAQSFLENQSIYENKDWKSEEKIQIP